MVTLLEAVVGALFAALRPRASLVIENLALRQQLSILLPFQAATSTSAA